MRKILALIALLVSSPAPNAATIRDDQGGRVSEYQRRVEGLRASGEQVSIRGTCASACTQYLSLPRDQVCAHPGSTFLFHSAADAQFGIPSFAGTMRLMSQYPPAVQAAVQRRGGMWLNTVRIPATELVPPCK